MNDSERVEFLSIPIASYNPLARCQDPLALGCTHGVVYAVRAVGGWMPAVYGDRADSPIEFQRVVDIGIMACACCCTNIILTADENGLDTESHLLVDDTEAGSDPDSVACVATMHRLIEDAPPGRSNFVFAGGATKHSGQRGHSHHDDHDHTVPIESDGDHEFLSVVRERLHLGTSLCETVADSGQTCSHLAVCYARVHNKPNENAREWAIEFSNPQGKLFCSCCLGIIIFRQMKAKYERDYNLNLAWGGPSPDAARPVLTENRTCVTHTAQATVAITALHMEHGHIPPPDILAGTLAAALIANQPHDCEMGCDNDGPTRANNRTDEMLRPLTVKKEMGDYLLDATDSLRAQHYALPEEITSLMSDRKELN